MKHRECLSNQDLTLHYYGELSSETADHLQTCVACRSRYQELADALDCLPELAGHTDATTSTRVAAKVTERLRRRQQVWLPLTGGAVAAVAALIITVMTWQHEPTAPTVPHTGPPQEFVLTDNDLPTVEFLEDLELLQELDVLTQIEGV